MNKVKKVFVLVLVAAIVSLGLSLTGCKKKTETTGTNISSEEHPEGEHPAKKDPGKEHPEGEHPEKEDPAKE